VTKDEKTDAEFGSTTDGRDGRHAVRPVEDDDGESWHDAREDGWGTTACGKANEGTGTEPEGELEGHIREEEVGNRHDRFGCDAIRMWIGQPRWDCDMNGEKG
jgi:hypothetical protein